VLSGLKDADGRIEQLERDSATGNIVAFTSADGHRTRFDYDLFGRLTTVTQSDNSQWQATYNAADLLASFIDPNGHATTFQYDDDNRLIEDRNPEGGGWVIDTQNKADFVSFLSGAGRRYQYQWEKTDEGLRRTITGADELQSAHLGSDEKSRPHTAVHIPRPMPAV
jgi:YD repeat-containing protein